MQVLLVLRKWLFRCTSWWFQQKWILFDCMHMHASSCIIPNLAGDGIAEVVRFIFFPGSTAMWRSLIQCRVLAGAWFLQHLFDIRYSSNCWRWKHFFCLRRQNLIFRHASIFKCLWHKGCFVIFVFHGSQDLSKLEWQKLTTEFKQAWLSSVMNHQCEVSWSIMISRWSCCHSRVAKCCGARSWAIWKNISSQASTQGPLKAARAKPARARATQNKLFLHSRLPWLPRLTRSCCDRLWHVATVNFGRNFMLSSLWRWANDWPDARTIAAIHRSGKGTERQYTTVRVAMISQFLKLRSW